MNFSSSKINDEIFAYINNKSYKDNKNISIDELRLVNILYYNFSNEIKQGRLIVNKDIVDDVLYIFEELYKNKYQLNNVDLIDKYWTGDNITTDDKSIKNNNTSCFNYRIIEGKNYLSYHAFGLAIDINPYNNPYVVNKNGKPDYSKFDEKEMFYAKNRDKTIPHVITHDDLAYKLFKERGFEWGGDWNLNIDSVDYQHFEKHMRNNKISM